jgi:hypothetical protein
MGSAFQHCRRDNASGTCDADFSSRALPSAKRISAVSRTKRRGRHRASTCPELQRDGYRQLDPARSHHAFIDRSGAWFRCLVSGLHRYSRGVHPSDRNSDTWRKAQGILILITSVVVLPVFILVASLASTLILGASVSEREKTQVKLIVENLRTLSNAKAKWIAQTKVTDGTRVTVAGLTGYLDGKEVKSIVGEIYDPRPVGQEPTATLPVTKSLGSHKKGAVLAVSGSSLAADTTSSSADLETEDEAPSPTASPQEL